MNSFNVALINIILLPAIVSRCVGNCQQMCWQLSADVLAIVSRRVGNCQQMCWQLSADVLAIVDKYKEVLLFTTCCMPCQRIHNLHTNTSYKPKKNKPT